MTHYDHKVVAGCTLGHGNGITTFCIMTPVKMTVDILSVKLKSLDLTLNIDVIPSAFILTVVAP